VALNTINQPNQTTTHHRF